MDVLARLNAALQALRQPPPQYNFNSVTTVTARMELHPNTMHLLSSDSYLNSNVQSALKKGGKGTDKHSAKVKAALNVVEALESLVKQQQKDSASSAKQKSAGSTKQKKDKKSGKNKESTQGKDVDVGQGDVWDNEGGSEEDELEIVQPHGVRRGKRGKGKKQDNQSGTGCEENGHGKTTSVGKRLKVIRVLHEADISGTEDGQQRIVRAGEKPLKIIRIRASADDSGEEVDSQVDDSTDDQPLKLVRVRRPPTANAQNDAIQQKRPRRVKVAVAQDHDSGNSDHSESPEPATQNHAQDSTTTTQAPSLGATLSGEVQQAQARIHSQAQAHAQNVPSTPSSRRRHALVSHGEYTIPEQSGELEEGEIDSGAEEMDIDPPTPLQQTPSKRKRSEAECERERKRKDLRRA
ncbi:Hypothetical predicted protein [Lecanosticta acicola]|uniref:Uncharacterized protein n=1 Tax=Lecanosticta acicola TaxID=111012 RepID=A0AAI9EFW0_9PEZI|nr:Hypothetical predicted protein [Lecanosticta acicola]